MEHIKVFLSNQKGNLTVKKTDKGFFGDLKVGNTLINSREAKEYSLDLKEYEGQTLEVTIDKNYIYKDGKKIAYFSNVFDDVLGKLGQLRSDKDECVLCIFGDNGKAIPITNVIDISELSSTSQKGLFDRRNQFPVRIYDDSNWMIVRYANLHQHTDSSLLDGMVKVKDLVKKTEWASVVTDHGNMHAFNEFSKAMKKAGKQGIIGCEVYVETVGNVPRKTLQLYKTEKRKKIWLVDSEKVRGFDSSPSANDQRNNEHLIILAENEVGLHNLFKLVTEASNNFYKHPHVTWENLEKYKEGLIITSACIAGTLGKSIQEIIKCETFPNLEDSKEVKENNEQIAKLFIEECIRVFGKDHFFIELQNHHFPLEIQIMNKIREYAKEYRLRTSVGIDAHYTNKEDARVHEMWLCNQTKTTMEDENRMRFSGDGYYIHNSDEVVQLFPNDLDALDNTLEIAERCCINDDNKGYHLPIFPLPEGETSEDEYLTKLVNGGFERLWNEGLLGTTESEKKKYKERIDYELGVIRKMGWQSYFLVVSDFIAYAEDDNVKEHLEKYFPRNSYNYDTLPKEIIKNYKIYVGTGRGSGAGSLVCCCLGITKVDPIKYDLLFERFLSPDRISMPDIDTDLEDSGREAVIEYCRYKYGVDHVSRIVTFGTAAAKNSLKTIVRVNALPVSLGNELANAIPNEPKITISKAEDENIELRRIENRDPKIKEVVKDAKQIEGLKTNRSIHACGVLISDKPVVNYMPQLLMKNPQGEQQVWTTELQGPECEEMGLLKMDFLGLITLGIAHETIDLIKKNHGIDIIYDEIPLDDLRVYQNLEKGNTTAVFQAESQIFTKTITGVLQDLDSNILKIENKKLSKEEEKQELKKLGEKMFLRVSDCNALVRPGPNQYVNDYTKNILGKPEDIKYDDPSMKEYLEATGGIMLYQEQVMLLCREMAGFTPGQADAIRKAMGKKHKEILDEFAEYFVSGSVEKGIKGCVANGIPENVARKVWADMEKFAGYAFNKSHAVAYSMHTVRTAWLSTYYYPEYMTAVLNACTNPEKVSGYISKIKEHGVKILPPSINESDANFSTDGTNIRFGLSGLKYLGTISKKIIDERQERGLFKDYSDFLSRMAKNQEINSRAIESLIYSGCLDGMDSSSRLAKILGMKETKKFLDKCKKEAKSNVETMSLFDEGIVDIVPTLDFDRTIPEMPKQELLDKEYEMAGFYISGHPLDEYSEKISSFKNIKSVFDIKNELEESNSSKTYNVVGIIKEVVKKYDKIQRPWWSIMLEDTTGSVNGRYFCKKEINASEIDKLFQKGNVVLLRGPISDNGYGLDMKIEYIHSIQNN